MADRAFQAEHRRCLADYSICRKKLKRLGQAAAQPACRRQIDRAESTSYQGILQHRVFTNQSKFVPELTRTQFENKNAFFHSLSQSGI